MMKGKHVFTLATAVAIVASSLLVASAATVPLATLRETGSAKTFTYTDNSPLFATFSITQTAGSFSFQSGFGGTAAGFSNIPVNVTLTSGVATSTVNTAANSQQVGFEIKIVGSGGPFAGDTLLDMMTGAITPGDPNGPQLSGPLNSTSAGINGSTAGDPVNTFITYSADSQFNPTQFNSGHDKDFSSGLTTLTNGIAPDGLTINFNGFSATWVFNFGATQAVPEPNTVAMLLGLGTSGTLLGLRRLRRRK